MASPTPPGSFAGQAGLVAAVNGGESALEFIAGGGGGGGGGGGISLDTWKRVSADGTLAVGDTDTVMTFPTGGISSGNFTESAGVFTCQAAGRYWISADLDFEDSGVFNILTIMQLDTGGGFNNIEETVMFNGDAVRNQTSSHCVLDLQVGDEIRVVARDVSSPATPTPDFRDGGQITFARTDAQVPNVKLLDYSTSEQELAQLWHDGKPVHQKTVLIASLPNSTLQADAHGITNLDELVHLQATIKRPSTFTLGQLPHVNDQSIGSQIQVSIDATNINTRTAADYSLWGAAVTLFYTRSDVTSPTTAAVGLSGMPTLPDDVEVPSGRSIGGKPTFLKRVTAAGNIGTGMQDFAHGITGLDEVYSAEIILDRDNGTERVPVPFNSGTDTFDINHNYVDDTNIRISVGTSWTGAGNTLSEFRCILEYSKV